MHHLSGQQRAYACRCGHQAGRHGAPAWGPTQWGGAGTLPPAPHAYQGYSAGTPVPALCAGPRQPVQARDPLLWVNAQPGA